MKRYFSTEDDTPVDTVQVEAIKRGTVIGKKGTFHFDPKGKDPLARKRTVPVEIALEAKRKGLVEYLGRGDETDAARTRGTPLYDAAASRRTSSVQKDGEELGAAEYFGASGSDTRDTTAFSRDPSKFARTGVQAEEDNTALTSEETEITELSGTEGDDDDEDEDEATERQTGSFQTDETLLQEGNARGADAPPRDEDDMADRHPMDLDQNGSTDTNQADESTADTSTVVDATTDTAAPAAAPKPRRNRTAAAQA